MALDPPATSTTVVTGYSLYTTEPAANAGDPNTVRLYSFSVDGQLTGNPTTLTGNALTKAKIATRSGFNGNNTTGVLIDQKLTDNNTPISSSLNLHVYNTQDNQLLLTDFTALAAGSDLAMAPNGALTPPLLTTADGNSFAINNNQSIVVALTVDSDGNLTNTIPNTDGFELILKDNNTSEITKAPSPKTVRKQLNLSSQIGRSRTRT